MQTTLQTKTFFLDCAKTVFFSYLVNVKTHFFSSVFSDSLFITQQICLISIFCSVFIYLYVKKLKIEHLFAIEVVLFFVVIGLKPLGDISLLKSAKSLFVFTMILAGLSPILKTLTEDTSCDTIWALTTLLFFVNCVFHCKPKPGAVSLNAAIFASVLLASRLETPVHVFGLIALAIILFTFFPIIRCKLKAQSAKNHYILTALLFAASFYFSYAISCVYCVLLTAICLTVSFISPYCFVKMQIFKNTINGPWDEATV